MAEETTTTTENTTNNNQDENAPDNGNQQSEQQVQADKEALNSVETATTTEVSPAATIPQVEKQGEVAIDKNAEADVVGGNQADDGQTQVDNIAQAKADALVNHAAHEASQPGASQNDTAAE